MQTVQIDRKTWIQIPDDADPVERKARWLARMAEANEKPRSRSPMTVRARRKAVVYDEWVEDAELTAASRAEETEAERKRKAEAKAKKEAEAKARAERRKEEDRERGRRYRAKAKAEREKAKAEKANKIAAIKPEYKPKRNTDWKAWYAWIKANDPDMYAKVLEQSRIRRRKMEERNPGSESRRVARWLAQMKENDPERYADILEKRRQYKKAYSQRRKAERAAQATEQ